MRIKALLRLFVTFILMFVTQKVVFMIFNMSMADGAPFLSCMASLWHGLRLDIATTCYLLLLPTLVLLISYFLKRFPLRKVLMPYYILVAIVLSLIFVADTILYSFWGAKLDANDLIYAAKPKDMLASLPVWATILAFLVVGLIAFHYYRRLRHATPKDLDKPHHLWNCLWVIPAVAAMFLGMRGGLTESTANPSYAYFSPHPFCNHAALNPAFNIFHSLFKVQDLSKEFNNMPESEVDALLGDAYEPDSTLADSLLNTTRPNILLVIWEGAGLGMVGTDSVAPNLHRYIKEGVYFSNCYANSYRTDRGIVSVLSGWLGLPTTTLVKRPDLCRKLPSIANSLRDVGYTTKIVYGGDIDFTNMRMYLSETGFTSVMGGDAFPSSLYSSAWGVPDEHLLQHNLLPQEEPFFAAALTLSSHEPWEVPMHKLDNYKRNAFAYTDSCLGAFLDGLKASDQWKNMLVIIVPDHGIPFVEGQPTSDIAVARIPMLWTGGAIREAKTIEHLCSQSDLAATLLCQMGISANGFPFSRNILGTRYLERRQFAMHSDKNCLNLVLPEGCWHYDCISRTLQPADSNNALFVEALLQRLYKTTTTL